MVVLSVLILNKAGGLIYQRDFNAGLQKLSANDYLVLAGTFHGVHAITARIAPVAAGGGGKGGGVEEGGWRCWKVRGSGWCAFRPSPVCVPPRKKESDGGGGGGGANRASWRGNDIGTKFLVFAEPHQPNVDVVVRRIYELYADYVMKNPFYQMEMPIRCEAFDRNLAAYIKTRQ